VIIHKIIHSGTWSQCQTPNLIELGPATDGLFNKQIYNYYLASYGHPLYVLDGLADG